MSDKNNQSEHQSQKPIPKPTEKHIFQAHTALGTGGDSNLRHVLSCFEMKVWAMEENNEWDKEKYRKYLAAKYILTHSFIFHQIDTRSDHKFSTRGQIPFQNPCRKCFGLGQRFKFVRVTKDVKCMKCNGTGQKKSGAKCPTCCPDKSEDVTPGILKIEAIISQFLEVTTCECCMGRGYIKVLPSDNAVVDTSTAAKLKRQLVQKQNPPEEVPSLGDAIQTAPPEEKPDEEIIETNTPQTAT